MSNDKKEAAPEVEAQKQFIKFECPCCHEVITISKVCPNCSWGCDKDANYCNHCGTKL